MGGPLDGQEIEVPTPVPWLLHVPYLAEAHDGVMGFDPTPVDLLHVPCPVQLPYRREPELRHSGHMIRYRYLG